MSTSIRLTWTVRPGSRLAGQGRSPLPRALSQLPGGQRAIEESLQVRISRGEQVRCCSLEENPAVVEHHEQRAVIAAIRFGNDRQLPVASLFGPVRGNVMRIADLLRNND